jgi:MFS family permease
MSDAAAPPFSRGYVRYAIGVVFLVSVFNVIDRTVIAILIPGPNGIQHELGLSDIDVGWLTGPAFSVVHFLAVLPCAFLADRTSRKYVIGAGLFVWSGMTALGAAAGGFFTLFLTRMGVGIGEAAGSPPAASLLSDTAPESMRARALSGITIGALVGVGGGLVVGGYLVDDIGWRKTLLAVGAPGLLVALLILSTIREPSRQGVEAARPTAALKHLLALPCFRWMLLAVAVTGISSMGRSMWEAILLARIYGMTGFEIGVTIFSVSAVPTMAGAFVGSSLADRLRERDRRWPLWVCAIGNLASTPFLLVFLLGPVDGSIGFVCWAIGSFFFGFFSAPTGAVAQSLARPNMRALVHAIWSMVLNIGLGPPIVGFLASIWASDYGDQSIRFAIAAVTAIAPLSAWLYWRAGQDLPRDLLRVAEGV